MYVLYPRPVRGVVILGELGTVRPPQSSVPLPVLLYSKCLVPVQYRYEPYRYVPLCEVTGRRAQAAGTTGRREGAGNSNYKVPLLYHTSTKTECDEVSGAHSSPLQTRLPLSPRTTRGRQW